MFAVTSIRRIVSVGVAGTAAFSGRNWRHLWREKCLLCPINVAANPNARGARCCCCCWCGWHRDAVGGARQINVDALVGAEKAFVEDENRDRDGGVAGGPPLRRRR